MDSSTNALARHSLAPPGRVAREADGVRVPQTRRRGLLHAGAGLLDAGADDDEGAVETGDAAADQEEVVLGDDVDHGEVLHGAPIDAHVTRHPLALEDAAGSLALADGAHVPVVLVARGGVAGGGLHVVALDDAREAEPAGGA